MAETETPRTYIIDVVSGSDQGVQVVSQQSVSEEAPHTTVEIHVNEPPEQEADVDFNPPWPIGHDLDSSF